ncbi:MAG: amino acid adenylation domain-containing protein [Blastocatellales bacterium]
MKDQTTIEGFRLSPQQARLWALQQGAQSASYTARCSVLIEGALDARLLEAALNQAAQRHEILRTTFHRLPAMTLPLQVIADASRLAILTEDLSGYAEEEQTAKLEQLEREISQTPFDFERGPLAWAQLIKLAPERYLLSLLLPALCADRTSLENLAREISHCYAAYLNGDELPAAPAQYADLAEWQNELLESAETEAGREYWRRRDFSRRLSIKAPFENRRGAGANEDANEPAEFAPEFLSVTANAELVAKLEARARAFESSAPNVLLACWQTLFWRLTGQTEIVIGAAYEHRKHEELKDALGLFTKYLPVHCRLGAGRRFSDVLEEINGSARELYKWQEYFTWEQIASSNGRINAAPFFPACFEFSEQPVMYKAGPITFSILRHYACVDRFKLKLAAIRRSDCLRLDFHYDAALFARDDIERLAGQFLTLLGGAVATPEAAIKDLNLLGSSERDHILRQFNPPQASLSPQPIHQLFEAQAARWPEATAVVVDDQRLSYGELNRRANQLAHHLRKLGVGPEDIVGLCLERSIELVVGMLGILKTGGAYLPLDPALPVERLTGMMADAKPRALVTQERLRIADCGLRIAEGNNQPEVICLDKDREMIARESEENPCVNAGAEHLVYVLFTSGSTGRPKGVAVEHRQLHAYLEGVRERLRLPDGANYATVTTFAADLGHTAIFPALCGGGTLHVVSKERAADTAAMSEYFTRHRIDCLKIVPSHLSALLGGKPGARQGARVLPRRRLVLGGEASGWELIARVREMSPELKILNHYGPTETTVGVLTCEVEQEAEIQTATVPLGRPLNHSRVYVLDGRMEPSPVWMSGEVYIGGWQVARGYLNEPEQTAAKFVPDPFSDEPGMRLYRTGDLARYLPDGRVEFLGRADHQVKIRGYRIELGEIESALEGHEAVGESVVLARESEGGEKRLVAYVSPRAGAEIDASELRRYVSGRLPEYMVPGAIVKLERMPLTANGKLDRAALPEPESEARGEYIAPRTQIEELVAGIWAELLKVERVGVNDNFFELGGHSLMATQLISRVREACEVDLPLRALFDAPTVAGMAESLEAAIKAGKSLQATPIEQCSRDADLPLSFAQQRLWFLDQLEPGSAFYNIFAPVRLKGRLNLPALERTLTEITRRHEVLRTTFPTVDGRAVQMIAPAAPLSLPVTDLTHLPPERREAEALRMAAEEAQLPFDLAHGPLVRARLLRLNEDEHLAMLTLSHIISDGWSAGILIREVAALYEAFNAGLPSPLAELPIQYADFAAWQRQWLQGEALDTQLAYWKRKLGGDPPALQLPTDRPRLAMQRHRGARQSFELSAQLSETLKSFSNQEGVTLFMTLLAAFKALLHRYTGQDDIIIGSPIANRNRIEIEGLVGFFVNTLPLRTDLSGDPSFSDLVSRVREVALEASAHQDLPFEKLVDELQLARDLSRAPLFQVVFVLQNTPRQTLELPGLTLTPMEVEGETAKFDLILGFSETERGLIARVEYNTDLFDAATISRMLAHFQNLLEGAIADPRRRLSELPMLTEAENRQLLEWNKSDARYPAETCLHQLFEAQAARTPNAIAVTFEGERMSYQQLNARANQLAHRLRALGVGPDVLVALCLDRSLDMVVAILAVLKAGGAYLPLDLAYPKDRLAFMLEDSRAQVLLTQRRLAEELRIADCGLRISDVFSRSAFRNPQSAIRNRVICLDSDWEQIAQESAENLENRTTAENLAYVIYTSGSTGKPKGVQVTHANVVRLFAATQDWYQFDERDVWTLFHSYAFDFSVWELWGALLYGGRLVVVPYWVSRSPEAFHELLLSEQVTVLNQTPSAFRQLIRAEESFTTSVLPRKNENAPPPRSDEFIRHVTNKFVTTWGGLALRLVIFGGEALELQSLKPWFDRHGDERPRLINMYGITETTVHVSFRPIRAADLEEGKGSVIGGAIPDLQVYAMDANLRPTPIGVSGEMYVGGAGVARGYLNRPELTAERFIPDPFGAEAGARLYRTGDLARYLADGDLEYLGRIDHQVKIRGFRIELGEIEAVLAAHTAVQEAIVLARDDKPLASRLVAYLVTKPDAAPSISELREFLKQKLPEYMTPAAFVMLDALPLTENGKLDRRALPAPDAARPELEEAYAAPRNVREETLAKIWAGVLGLERIGIHDNFFELGGDSILSIQIIARANQAGLRLTPKQVFQCQTIAELAAAAVAAPAIEAEQGLVTGSAPLTPIQRWFFEQRLPDRDHWNQALLFETRQALNPALMEQAVARLIEHHDALRLRFTPEDAGWRQTIASPDAAAPFSVIELSGVPEAERSAAIESKAAELQASLNLSEGPLLRAVYFDLGNQEAGRLLIIIHHLAIDGVSWRILLEDLQAAYQQLNRGEEIALPPKTTSFKRWAEKLAEYAQSETARAEQDFWMSEARAKAAWLPVDFSGGANTEASARSVSVSLSVEETRALLQEAPEAYHTQINDLLLTALGQALAEWTGERSLLVNLEGHGREDIFDDVDLSRTVGWFTAIYPVLLRLEKASALGESLKSVKEQLRAIPQRGLGYGLLRYLTDDEEIVEALRRLPQAEVSFNYLGQLDQALPADSLLAPARESAGPVHSPRGRRKHLLDVRGSVARGRLNLSWTFSENIHRRGTIERLAQSYIESLRALIAHCQSPEAGGYTPSDFPLAQLDQVDLDQAFAEIEFE